MKILKRLMIAVVALIVLAAIAVFVMLQLSDRKRARQVNVTVAAVALPTDAASLDHGRYLYLSRGCAECHAANGGGREFVNEGGMRLRGADISGNAPTVAAYRTEDWVRTIRHGVKPDGRPALIMPSEDYNRLTDADLGALVAHIKQLPPAGGGPTVVQLPALVRVLYAAGVVQDAAEKIDHRLPPAQPVAVGVSTAHGEYVAQGCIGCHGPGLSGGRIPGGPPDWPAAANLTPGGGSAMARYATADLFVQAMRSGKRPDGSAISTVMPFGTISAMNDTDLQATYAYLKSLPPRAAGGR